jgi:homogentisate 1,2-dioxygenase
MGWDDLLYQHGFGNEFESQAIEGALPVGQFSPQQVPHGLYAEQFSSMAFTVERARQRRTWFYRIRPSVVQGPRVQRHAAKLRTAPDSTSAQIPEALRWNALAAPDLPVTFLDSLVTLASNGDADQHRGMAAHLYCANNSHAKQYLAFNDGELLFIPQSGELLLATECGRLRVAPGEIAVIPLGMRFKVEFTDDVIRGYVCENYGEPFQLPERGVIGANGLANARDFAYPVAAFEAIDEPCELIVKYAGSLSSFSLEHSPLDVVAWVGNSAPYKYDLARFNVINSVSFDHLDPSIFTVLSSPSMNPGVANVDFVIFPPRWVVAEHTFRPPYYHRNVMSELMGLIRGVYDAREHGFVPGGASLHNAMVPHGPEAGVAEKASDVELLPTRISDSLAFMLETPYRLRPAQAALVEPWLQSGYGRSWEDIPRRF